MNPEESALPNSPHRGPTAVIDASTFDEEINRLNDLLTATRAELTELRRHAWNVVREYRDNLPLRLRLRQDNEFVRAIVLLERYLPGYDGEEDE